MMMAMAYGYVFIHLNEAAPIETLENSLFWGGEAMNGEAYDELVSLIYECVLDESAWLRLLERLAAITGRRDGTLLFWDRGARQAPRTSAVSLCSLELQRDYDDCFGAIDPSQRFMAARPVGSWYFDVEEYGFSHILHDSFYQEFLRSHGLKSTSSIKLYEQEGAGAYLSLLTALDAPMPGDRQQMLLRRLATHLTQAAQMSSRIQRMELDVTHRQLLLEQSATAQWLVNAEGRVLFCNGAAERWMTDARFPLRERQGRLICIHEGLSSLLRAACDKPGTGRAGWLRLPGVTGELLVTPLRCESRLRLDVAQPLALVVLLGGRSRAELLVELFSCTPAEVRLANLIARGFSPEDCAARLAVSINTVRSQLRALFRKTDTERQGELVGLLVRLGV